MLACSCAAPGRILGVPCSGSTCAYGLPVPLQPLRLSAPLLVRRHPRPPCRVAKNFGKMMAPNLMLLFLPVPHLSFVTWLTGVSRNQLIRYHRQDSCCPPHVCLRSWQGAGRGAPMGVLSPLQARHCRCEGASEAVRPCQPSRGCRRKFCCGWTDCKPSRCPPASPCLLHSRITLPCALLPTVAGGWGTARCGC